MQKKTATLEETMDIVVAGVCDGRKVLVITHTKNDLKAFHEKALPLFEAKLGVSLPVFPRQVTIGETGLLKFRASSETRGLCNFNTLVVMPGCDEKDIAMAASSLRGENVTDPQVIHVLENNNA